MNSALRLTRRACLRVLSGLVALGLAPALFRGEDRSSPRDRVLALVPRRRSAARVGRAFLARHPAEADEAALIGFLARGMDPEGTRSAAQHRLRDRVRADFARGDTVQVQGWILSLTEARLYALAAMADAGATDPISVQADRGLARPQSVSG
jgi:hypothetical protein